MLSKWLQEDSDSEHPLGCCEILERWEKIGISTDRRSVYKDIETLKAMGFDIQCERKSQNYYHIADKKFELAELKLLVDAVEASQIIPQKETDALVKKIVSFTTLENREELSRPVIVDKVFKNTNPEAMVNTDLLYQAIRKRKKISFQYYDYTPKKKKCLKHDGMVYGLSPYFLKWNSDKYYVVGYSDDHNNISHFRVDRMTGIRILNCSARRKPEGFNPQKYATKVFGMYSADLKEVILRCSNERIKDVVDKFGKNVKIQNIDAENFEITVEVEPSPPFFGWVFQFGGSIRVDSPEEVKQEMASMMDAFK